LEDQIATEHNNAGESIESRAMPGGRLRTTAVRIDRIVERFLRSCRGGGYGVSTGCAAAHFATAPLHPWLQSPVPPGPHST